MQGTPSDQVFSKLRPARCSKHGGDVRIHTGFPAPNYSDIIKTSNGRYRTSVGEAQRVAASTGMGGVTLGYRTIIFNTFQHSGDGQDILLQQHPAHDDYWAGHNGAS